MNRIFAIFFLFFLLISTSKAQENIKFGFSLGPNYMSPYFPDYGEKIGFQGGIYSKIPMNQKIYLQIEMLIAGKKYEDLLNNIKIKQSVSYIDFPVSLNYEITKLISIYAGGQIGFRNSFKYKLSDQTLYSLNIQEPDKLVLSPVFGLKLKSNKNIGIDFRYSIGLESSREHVSNLRGYQILISYEI